MRQTLPARTRGDRAHAALLFLAALLIAAYWIVFFTTNATKPAFVTHPATPTQATQAAIYMGFESAFPLPDAFVAITAAIAAIYLAARHPKAILFGLVSGGGLMFLALIDIFFNVTQGLYSPRTLRADPGMQLEVLINVACVTFALWSIRRLWTHILRAAA